MLIITGFSVIILSLSALLIQQHLKQSKASRTHYKSTLARLEEMQLRYSFYTTRLQHIGENFHRYYNSIIAHSGHSFIEMEKTLKQVELSLKSAQIALEEERIEEACQILSLLEGKVSLDSIQEFPALYFWYGRNTVEVRTLSHWSEKAQVGIKKIEEGLSQARSNWRLSAQKQFALAA